jgi:hypothetical protein
MPQSKRQYQHVINTKTVALPEDIVATLKELNKLLPGSEVQTLLPFNKAYIVVTEKLNTASKAGRFEHTDIMNNLELEFAHLYFQALNNFAEKGSLPRAWQKVNQRTFSRYRPRAINVMLGASAHINHDLLPAMRRTIKKPQEFAKDYAKVSGVLLSSAVVIADDTMTPASFTMTLKTRGHTIYTRPAMWIINRWRTKVWKEFTD